MSLLRLPFVLASLGGVIHVLTPPAPPAKANEITKGDEKGFVSIFLPAFTKTIIAFIALGELLTTISLHYPDLVPPSIPKAFLLNQDGNPEACSNNVVVTPSFVVLSLISIVCSYLRHRSFKDMGDMFTFDLAFKTDHRLVTKGSYSLVRHPGYTGGLGAVIGFLWCHCSKGSWFSECFLPAVGINPMKVFVGMLLLDLLFVVVVFRRIKIEDALLKEQFQKEWVSWAKDVPNKLVPFVW